MFEDELARLLAPKSVDEFRADYWSTRPLHCRGDESTIRSVFGVGSEYFTPERVDAVSRFGRSYQRETAETQSGKATIHFAPVADHAVVHDEERVRIQDAHKSGWTLQAMRPQVVDPTFGRFASVLVEGLGLYAEAEVMAWSGERGSGMPTHFDEFDIYHLQVMGEKRWNVSSSPEAQWPADQSTALNGTAIVDGEKRSVDEGSFSEIVVKPGDFLYMPAGTWHRTEALAPRSVSVSVALKPFDLLELCTDILRSAIRSKPTLRAMLPPRGAAPRSTLSTSQKEAVWTQLQEMSTVLASVDADDEYLHRFLKSKAARQFNVALPSKKDPAASDTSVVFVRLPAEDFQVAEMNSLDHRAFVIFLGEHSVEFETDDEIRFAKALCNHERFAMEECLDWAGECADEAPAWLAGLESLGLLRRAGAT